MQSPKTKTLTTASSPADAFDALAVAVKSGKYDLVSRDDDQRRLTFTSGKTLTSWGHEYVADVLTTGEGTVVQVLCGGVDNRPKALLDGRKNAKAAEKVLEAVSASLAG